MIVTTISAMGQRKTNPTDTLRIIGKIKSELSFTWSDFDTFKVIPINDIAISNQEGEIKKTLKGLKGILVKNILEKAEIKVEKPKFLNEYYFVFVAFDGYKTIFSWNEIFNSDIGNTTYLIMEQEGKSSKETEERIAVISTKDFITGKRYVKGLERIIVERVNAP